MQQLCALCGKEFSSCLPAQPRATPDWALVATAVPSNIIQQAYLSAYIKCCIWMSCTYAGI